MVLSGNGFDSFAFGQRLLFILATFFKIRSASAFLSWIRSHLTDSGTHLQSKEILKYRENGKRVLCVRTFKMHNTTNLLEFKNTTKTLSDFFFSNRVANEDFLSVPVTNYASTNRIKINREDLLKILYFKRILTHKSTAPLCKGSIKWLSKFSILELTTLAMSWCREHLSMLTKRWSQQCFCT